MQITIRDMLKMYAMGLVAYINDGEVWAICYEEE